MRQLDAAARLWHRPPAPPSVTPLLMSAAPMSPAQRLEAGIPAAQHHPSRRWSQSPHLRRCNACSNAHRAASTTLAAPEPSPAVGVVANPPDAKSPAPGRPRPAATHTRLPRRCLQQLRALCWKYPSARGQRVAFAHAGRAGVSRLQRHSPRSRGVGCPRCARCMTVMLKPQRPTASRGGRAARWLLVFGFHS